MKKWPFYAIIFLMFGYGLKLCADELEEKFYYMEVQAPDKASEAIKESPTTSGSAKKTPQASELGEVISPMQNPLESDTINHSEAKTSKTIDLAKINEMSASELESLNGVGPVLAKRIFEYKKAHGPFKILKDLLKVKGIGEKKLEKIKEQMAP